MEIQIKRTIAILLAVCFLVSLTAGAVSGHPEFKEWKATHVKEKKDKPNKDSDDISRITIMPPTVHLKGPFTYVISADTWQAITMTTLPTRIFYEK